MQAGRATFRTHFEVCGHTEYDLLYLLLAARKQVQGRQRYISQVWGS